MTLTDLQPAAVHPASHFLASPEPGRVINFGTQITVMTITIELAKKRHLP